MRSIAFLIFAGCFGQAAVAQQIIQQPIVSTTSVNTTVSVPDRGTALMGGVSSAQSARNQYGPLRTNSSRGFAREATTISTNVYIHDLQAMDEALLNSVSTESSVSRVPTGNQARRLATREAATLPKGSAAEKATKFEQLARKADDAGKSAVAKLHWQVAAKYGSKLAETRLDERSRAPSPQTVVVQSHE